MWNMTISLNFCAEDWPKSSFKQVVFETLTSEPSVCLAVLGLHCLHVGFGPLFGDGLPPADDDDLPQLEQ